MPSASDLERFVYCARNWYLATTGVDGEGEPTRKGIEAHATKGKKVKEYRQRLHERRRAITWANRLLLALTSSLILTFEVLYFEATPQGIILLVLGLVFISAAVALFIIAGDEGRRAKQALPEGDALDASIVRNHLTGPGEPMEDPEWNLTGTPDYVMQTHKGIVPVDVKTGRTPNKPHDSHIIKLAAYLRLIEATTGKSPHHGLLTYPEGSFVVLWDDETKGKLRDAVTRLQAAQAKGVADRDHEHPGRCAGCSRRAQCTQALA